MNSISNSFNNRDLFIGNQLHADKPAEAKTDAMGKDAFLTMMVAQLKHQDPLNPLDGTDFTAQLAQFSSLEQGITMNKTLSDIKASLSNEKAQDNVFNYLGKDIVSDGNPVTLAGGETLAGGDYSIEEPAQISIVVYDANGNAVRTIDSGRSFIEAGSYNIKWDGKDDNGYTLQNGDYTYDVIARNNNDQYIPVSTTTRGKVDGLTDINGKTYLLVNDNTVDPDSVRTIKEPEAVQE